MQEKITLKISGMSCTACAKLIKMSLDKVLGVENVSVDYASAKADVVFDNEKTNVGDLVKTVKEGGYEANL